MLICHTLVLEPSLLGCLVTRVKGKQTALLTTTKGQIKEIVSEAISLG